MMMRDFRGDKNPNYKGVAHATKLCASCGDPFHPGYCKTRKYCSHRCYGFANRTWVPPKPVKQAKPAKPKPIRKQRPERNCLQCGLAFKYSPSQKRKYCSYKCHLDSGGAVRAGLRAAEAVMRYGAKKDANHVDIVKALEKCGCFVLDISTVGRGLPDLLVHRHGHAYLCEIKNRSTGYGRRGPNKNQRAWADAWPVPVYILRSLEDAVAFSNGNLTSLESYGGMKGHAILGPQHCDAPRAA